MAYRYTNSQGQERHLLNPSEKGRKYAKELKTGCDVYTGEQLTQRQKAWRAGYNTARSDSAKAYNHNVKKGKVIKADHDGRPAIIKFIFPKKG